VKHEDLEKLCKDALEKYPDKVNNYKLGKTSLLGLFTGEVMKNSKNTADPEQTVKMLKQMLQS
jgi:aspartyl-tRNA(Asn)/glutamyl-tRNA(Gln) amidotransferase subunit B